IGDVDPDVNVGFAAEVPDEGWAFKTPIVPDAIVAEIAFLVEGEVALIQTALGIQALDDFIAVGGAEGLEEDLEDALQFLALIARHIGDGDALEDAQRAAETDLFFGGHAGDDECFFLLSSIEHVIEHVGFEGLWPEDVVRVIGALVQVLGLVSVEDGAGEGHVLGAVAIAPESHMPAGENKLELASARLSKNSDALAVAKPTDIILELLVEAAVPVGAGNSFKNGADHGLLVGSVEGAVDDG